MTNTSGQRLSTLRAAKQIFMAYGEQALTGDWADCANEYSDIDAESATQSDRLEAMRLVRSVAINVKRILRL